jgi:hypothetical protein
MMTYNVSLKQKGRDPNHAKIRIRLEGTGEDCQFLYQVVTFALGNPVKMEKVILATQVELEGDGDDENKPMGFVQ